MGTTPDGTRPEALLEEMILIRRFEERTSATLTSGGFMGTCTCVGQEASAVGVVSALGPQDLILTNHRSAGHLLARGADPGRILAEVMGRSTGYCKGKSGTLHVSVKELGVILTSTIVGGELSLAPGVGLSVSMKGGDAVVACFFGDGAACEGVFHESVNLAAVWNLPVLFVCENNQWQAFVHRKETMLGDNIAPRAAGYGMEWRGRRRQRRRGRPRRRRAGPSRRIRETGKPFLLETYTYRQRGHFEPDDQSYVDPAELASWKARDPIGLLTAALLERGSPHRGGSRPRSRPAFPRSSTRRSTFASASPYPGFAELTTDVYA